MNCECGKEIDVEKASNDMWTCDCGRCWEILNGKLFYSGMKEQYTSNEGINYSGFGNGHVTNRDVQTGIRYGIISVHSVIEMWMERAEGHYPCEDCEDGDEECEADGWLCRATAWKIEDEEYHAFQSEDDTDIFVTKSPYFTYAQFCSPCAPGACHL